MGFKYCYSFTTEGNLHGGLSLRRFMITPTQQEPHKLRIWKYFTTNLARALSAEEKTFEC